MLIIIILCIKCKAKTHVLWTKEVTKLKPLVRYTIVKAIRRITILTNYKILSLLL
jgi:hypothetical protein